MSRKRLEKEARKKQIKQVALDLFIKKGYQATTIQDIVHQANYSKGGFYNCYASKADLFQEILQDSLNFREGKMREYKQNHPHQDRKTILMQALMDKLLDSNDYKKLFVTLIMETRTNPSLYQIYMNFQKRARQQFIDFCKEEGYLEFIQITNDDTMVFMTSIIVGVEIFKYQDQASYRKLVYGMMEAYFDKIDFFATKAR